MTKIFATLKPQMEFELCSTHLPPTPNNLSVTMTLKKKFKKKLASEPLGFIVLSVLSSLVSSWG